MSERTPLLGHHRRAPPVYAYPAVIAVLLLLLFPILLIAHNLPNKNEAIWIRNLGAYAPLIPHRIPPLPGGCSVDQVSVLHRHTARYPTSGAAVRLRKTLAKLVNATDPFLRTADLTMKGWEFGELTQPGREAARASGLDFRHYALPPFIRSSGARRVLDSAHLFLSSLGRGIVDVIIPEGESVNNTLCVHSCPAQRSSHSGETQVSEVIHLLGPAAARLSSLWNVQLEPEDIPNIAGMCGFDSARTGRWSSWCSLLTTDEWEAVGYVGEVGRWYAFGGGSAGWVNELVARLTDSAVVDGTCTNRTLDANPATFPLGQRLFIDFTHDNEMVAIQAALGINRRVLVQGSVPPREWVLSEIVPFGARWRDRVMPVERPECGGTLCPLDAFVASQKESRERDWAICAPDGMEISNQDAYIWML
ncbi:hypothetical protein CcaverHIS641_0102250 [Cutaneotrichosporon cavernicola]|nr:hypothetical protein CcaverHIS641_0102250 [Cutaneotrichosporon cavernicola]